MKSIIFFPIIGIIGILNLLIAFSFIVYFIISLIFIDKNNSLNLFLYWAFQSFFWIMMSIFCITGIQGLISYRNKLAAKKFFIYYKIKWLNYTYLMISYLLTISLMEIFCAATQYSNNKYLTNSTVIILVYFASFIGWIIDWIFYYIVFSFYYKFKKPEYLKYSILKVKTDISEISDEVQPETLPLTRKNFIFQKISPIKFKCINSKLLIFIAIWHLIIAVFLFTIIWESISQFFFSEQSTLMSA